MGFLFTLSLIGNAIALYYALTQRKARLSSEERTEAERAILRQAMYLHGRLTAVDVAAHSRIPLANLEATLRELVAENQCLSDLDEQGRAIYVFPQFDDSAIRQEATERAILRAVRIHNGELTIEQLALATDLTLSQARLWLSELTARGDCIAVKSQGNQAPEKFRFGGLTQAHQQGR
jgi:uncharacterized protein YcaQ